MRYLQEMFAYFDSNAVRDDNQKVVEKNKLTEHIGCQNLSVHPKNKANKYI